MATGRYIACRNEAADKPCSVFWKGKWFLAQYGQFDGYPEGQGAKIFKFLSVAHNIENLKAGLENHIYEPTAEELEAIYTECEAWDENLRAQGNSHYERNMVGINQLYPSLARETSAGILGIIARASKKVEAEGEAEKESKKIPVHLGLEFATDTLFCEWAYVIDIDKEVFEVFGGGEKWHAGHRFADARANAPYVPALVCSFDFSELYLLKDEDEYMDKVTEALSQRKSASEDSEDDDEKGGMGVESTEIES